MSHLRVLRLAVLLAFIIPPLPNPAIGQLPPPPHHDRLPADPLPDVMDPHLIKDPALQRVYLLASLIREVLYQQPCYCYCNMTAGHKSLLDCFRSNHGEHCVICQQEVIYSYREMKAGKTPAQIRAGIDRGEWKSIKVKEAALLIPPDVPGKKSGSKP